MKQIVKVVGVGASAGGLEAINSFFDHIPSNTGLAFVVIQHLSIDFKSLMDELLKKHTEMPIKVIDSDIEVEENHIYLISAASNIVIEKGVIKQVKRNTSAEPNLPIDLFFHSLGRDLGSQAIGVILSGTGTDGSRGVKTIKEVGGLVYVQNPDTAQFNGMPLAAKDMADAILSAPDIARELIGIVTKTNTFTSLTIDLNLNQHRKLFQKILLRIEEVTGTNFEEYRTKTLVRRLEKRMYLNHFSDLTDYYLHIMNNVEETNLLFKECLIGVTQFFRDSEAFEVLNNQIIPNLFESANPKAGLRIWIPGCSTGAEAYSMAILLAEFKRKNSKYEDIPFKIFASDIDPEAIKVAISGRFTQEIIEDIPPLFLDSYFEKKQNFFYIRKRIRERIVFNVHNALQDPPFIKIDMISCRNMMIYLNNKAQENLMINFLFSLKLNGVLFLGPSESLNSSRKYYNVLNSKWNFYQKAVDERPVPASSYQARKVKNESKSPLKKPSYITDYGPKQDDIFARMLSSLHAPKALFVNSALDILYINGDMENILKFPVAFAELNLKSLVDDSIEWVFSNGVRKALETDEILRYNDIQLKKKDKVLLIDTTFSKVTFREIHEDYILITLKVKGEESASGDKLKVIEFDQFKDERLKALEHELREIKIEKHKLQEQLGTTNEELQSSNEELLASNEELQSTNQELQSVNEELYTVNMELQSKIKELVVSNNDISNLLQSTQIGTIFLDQKLNIRKFTPALREQFNLQENDIGRPITDFTNSINDDKIYSEIKLVLAENKSIEREIQDKNKRFYLMRILPYKTNAGVIDGAVITFIDINNMKNSFITQASISQQYKSLYENGTSLVSLIDDNGTVKTSNIDFFAGLERRDLIGANLTNLAAEEYKEITEASISKLKKEKQAQHFITKWNSPDDTELWIENNLNPVVENGEIQSIAWVSRDITETKKRETQLIKLNDELKEQIQSQAKTLSEKNVELEEINAYLDAFVHGAAHDLRSPVSRMKGMINLLPNSHTEEQKEKVFKSVQEGILSLDKTLSGLIEMVEFQKNTDKLLSKVDLKELYKEVLNQLKHELKESNASIKTFFGKNTKITYIRAYATSIMFNLMNNAIKYRSYDRPLKIEIRIEKQGEFFLLSIQDNGIGIDMNRYGHFLFKPFKRLTVDRIGTGIGLSIINNAVKKNGGRIEVESKLDKGALFKVYLKPYSVK